MFRKQEGEVIKGSDYQLEIHKAGYDEVMLMQLSYACEEDEEDGTNIIESEIQQVQVEDTLSLDDRCEEFFKQMEEKLDKEEPVMISQALGEINEWIESERKNIHIPEMTSALFHYKIDNFFVLPENDIRKDTSATKLGSMLYKSTRDLLKLIHTILLSAEVSLEDQEGSEILLGNVGKKPAPALTGCDLLTAY